MSFWKTFVKKSNTSSDRDDLLESIHYQLTTLLNSEAPMRLIPSVYSETQKSIYCFGLDNSQSQSSQIEKVQFSRALERLIQSFEPRLSEVSVFVQEGDQTKNAICFSIMAKVNTSAGEHVFLFDSNLSLSNQQATMEGQEVV